MRSWRTFAGMIAVACLLGAKTGTAQPLLDIAGEYCITGVREVGSCFRLLPDQSFQYFLSYGAYDEQSEGRWRQDGADILLDSPAYDRKPSFSFKERRPALGNTFEIVVVNQAARGIPGVDIRGSCDTGSIEGYTQVDGYITRCTALPQSLLLGISMIGLAPQPVALASAVGSGKALVFTFDPGDLGRKAFSAVRLRRDGSTAFILTYSNSPLREFDGKQFRYQRSN